MSDRLNEDVRKLIAELGSSAVQSLGFRDNWVFVGGKGATVKSKFEKVTDGKPRPESQGIEVCPKKQKKKERKSNRAQIVA